MERLLKAIGYAAKPKGFEILSALCSTVVSGDERQLIGDLPAVFYGVTPATKHLWEQAKREGRDWMYCDNAYFDACRGTYFRVTKNRLQHPGLGVSDGKRFAQLEAEDFVHIAPMRRRGKHIVIAPQSDEFMQVVVGYPADRRWVDDVQVMLRKHTGRELVFLPWQRDKTEWYRRLPAALAEAHALVTYSSASVISAVLSGVPGFVMTDDCIAYTVTQSPDEVENPIYRSADERRQWAEVVADNQWTLEEMRSGLCEAMLREKATA